MSPVITDGPPAATHLLAINHNGGQINEFRETFGNCCFCNHEGAGVPVDDVVRGSYCNDHNICDNPGSDFVCAYCAYCLNQRELNRGHWVVTPHRYRSASTSDLLSIFRDIEAGNLSEPLAFHVSGNPTKSEYAYLWTPVVYSKEPLQLSYGRQRVLLEWGLFSRLLDAIGELRRHGVPEADIVGDETGIDNAGPIDPSRYWKIQERLNPYRGSPQFKIALLITRGEAAYSKSDQSSTNDDNRI